MPGNLNLSRIGASLLLALASAAAAGQADPPQLRLEKTEQSVVAFFHEMADLTCTESVLQQKLAPNGHVQLTQRSQFDYLVMLQAGGDNLHLNESRIESPGSSHKPLPLLLTNGFSMLLLVFHPYYRASFRFEPAEIVMEGQSTLRTVHFSHIRGTRSPAALALRGREYPLDLDGTAWIDQGSGQITGIEATVAGDMTDIGLRALTIHVEYRPSAIASAHGMELPDRAVIDLETPRQHWRNTHVFGDYKSFSTTAQQAPAVKVVSTGDSSQTNTKASPKPHSPERP